MVKAVIRALGHSVPDSVRQDELWDGFFADYFRGDRRAAVAWRRSGVDRRGGVALPPGDDVSGWGTAARMERFHRDAPPLAVEAANRALEGAGVSVGRVDQLLTVTCTGYGTPGVDAALAAKLGLGEATTSVTLGHMGCHAALPGLGVAADAASARQRTVLLVCVELPSLHLQAPGTDLDQIVAHSLFADAAAAAVVTPGGPGWEVVDDASHTDRAWEEMLTWEVTDHGFRMGLSPRLPQVLAPRVAPLVDALLHRNRLRRSDVAGWAVHPGGPRVVDVVGDRLGLEAGQLEASRAVLTEHGNCSSPTVLMVLERLDCWHTAPPGTWVVAVAFGPGLTIHATLLQRNPGF